MLAMERDPILQLIDDLRFRLKLDEPEAKSTDFDEGAWWDWWASRRMATYDPTNSRKDSSMRFKTE
jgi:hypothetical protein